MLRTEHNYRVTLGLFLYYYYYLLLWQCEKHRYADIIKFSWSVYTL